MPQQGTTGIVLDVFKELVWDSLVKAAIQKLLIRFTFLAWGPIGALITWVVTKYSDELYEAVKMFIEIEVIVFKNLQLKKEYDRASVTLKAVARANGIESVEFRKARDEDKKSLSQFIRFDHARAS